MLLRGMADFGGISSLQSVIASLEQRFRYQGHDEVDESIQIESAEVKKTKQSSKSNKEDQEWVTAGGDFIDDSEIIEKDDRAQIEEEQELIYDGFFAYRGPLINALKNKSLKKKLLQRDKDRLKEKRQLTKSVAQKKPKKAKTKHSPKKSKLKSKPKMKKKDNSVGANPPPPPPPQLSKRNHQENLKSQTKPKGSTLELSNGTKIEKLSKLSYTKLDETNKYLSSNPSCFSIDDNQLKLSDPLIAILVDLAKCITQKNFKKFFAAWFETYGKETNFKNLRRVFSLQKLEKHYNDMSRYQMKLFACSKCDKHSLNNIQDNCAFDYLSAWKELLQKIMEDQKTFTESLSITLMKVTELYEVPLTANIGRLHTEKVEEVRTLGVGVIAKLTRFEEKSSNNKFGSLSVILALFLAYLNRISEANGNSLGVFLWSKKSRNLVSSLNKSRGDGVKAFQNIHTSEQFKQYAINKKIMIPTETELTKTVITKFKNELKTTIFESEIVALSSTISILCSKLKSNTEQKIKSKLPKQDMKVNKSPKARRAQTLEKPIKSLSFHKKPPWKNDDFPRLTTGSR